MAHGVSDEAKHLLAALQVTALRERIGIYDDPSWLDKLTELRRRAVIPAAAEATISTHERLSGGYWVSAPDEGQRTVDAMMKRIAAFAGKRFIPRDTCVKCDSHKRDHLDSGQCLFVPGCTFEETKP